MSFEAIVKAIEINHRMIGDDSIIGQETDNVPVYAIAHVVQRNGSEYAALLNKDDSRTVLRGIYLDEEEKPRVSEYTIGGVVYLDEIDGEDKLVDLQHYPTTRGTVLKTWVFGMKEGGCVPRPAPVVEAKPVVAKKDEKKDPKKDNAAKVTYADRGRPNVGLNAGKQTRPAATVTVAKEAVAA